MSAAQNLAQASAAAAGKALASGALFNVSNILLVAAIDAAGMSVAFPICVGLALVIGTFASYIQTPKGDLRLLLGGVVLVLLAMLMSGIAHSKLPRAGKSGWLKGVIFAVVAGFVMGFFYPQLMGAISRDFSTGAILPGYLTPYAALVLFGAGLALSNFVVNAIFMLAGGWRASDFSRLRASSFSRAPWRRYLDARARFQRDRLGSGRPRYFLRTGPGGNFNRRHLGRSYLERPRACPTV
jgi:glucose uptake protein